MKKIGCLIICLTVLSGCATQEKFEAQLNKYKGVPENEIIAKFGTPDRSYETGDAKYITFYKDKENPIDCEMTFKVKDGVVTYWIINGPECKSR